MKYQESSRNNSLNTNSAAVQAARYMDIEYLLLPFHLLAARCCIFPSSSQAQSWGNCKHLIMSVPLSNTKGINEEVNKLTAIITLTVVYHWWWLMWLFPAPDHFPACSSSQCGAGLCAACAAATAGWPFPTIAVSCVCTNSLTPAALRERQMKFY